MKEINIGKMNKKIYICTPRTTQDEMGQDIMTYEKGKRIWATVKSVRGGEYYDALKLSPEVSYIIYTRYRKRHTSRYNPYVSRKETGSEACS